MKTIQSILSTWLFKKLQTYILEHPEEFVGPLRDGSTMLTNLIAFRADGRIDEAERAALEDQAKGLLNSMMRLFQKALRS